MPGMGGYWLCPACMAAVTAFTSSGAHSKSGKPWPRLTALCSVARADITVKMVVPTWGSLLGKAGVRAAALAWVMAQQRKNQRCFEDRRTTAKSQLIVVDVPRHRTCDKVTAQPVAEQFGKFIDKVAQVGAALEGNACHALPEKVAHRAHGQVAHLVVAHGHLGHDADAQAQAHVGFDHVRVDGFEHDARLKLAGGKGLVDLAPAGERGDRK